MKKGYDGRQTGSSPRLKRWRYLLAGVATFFIAPLLLVIPDHLADYPVGILIFAPFLLFIVLLAGTIFVILDRFGLRSWSLSLALGSLLGGLISLASPHIAHGQVLAPTAWQTTLRFIIAGAASGVIFHLVTPRRLRRD